MSVLLKAVRSQVAGRGMRLPLAALMHSMRGLPATPRLRADTPGLNAVRDQPALLEVAAPFTFAPLGVNPEFPLSDEPFPIRDIQFDDPEIVVLALPAIAVVPEFFGIFRILLARQLPCPRTIGLWHTFVSCGIGAVLATNHKQRAGVAFTFCDHRGEPSCSLDRANQAGNLEMRGQARVHVRRAGDIRQGRTARCASA